MTQDIHQIYAELQQQLAHHPIVVVTAPPGAGKSTILPLQLLESMGSGKMVMLEPRRLAARQIAERMASTLGEPVGQRVGYRVRFDNKVSPATRIEVLTEGILTRQLIADPTLDGVEMVVFDEFHERSLTSDVALALTREVQQLVRPDLRILIMSATIDTQYICQQLGAPLVEMQSRAHKVDILHTDDDLKETARPAEIASAVAAAVRGAHAKHDGDILAFLPGQAEIMACQVLLDGALASTDVYPLYGLLTGEQQRRAIAPSVAGRRKVVLATPIAETSLTIEGVRVVVDAGLCRQLVFNQQNGLSHLATVRISRDMAIQRAGRAGRVADGVCYRLWSLATEHRMADSRKPEIEEADLASTLLDISAWGEPDMQSLRWLTPPPAGNVAQARRLLLALGAIDSGGAITSHGKRLALLPCHPRIAQMLTMARGSYLKALAADVAALLEEKDPMADGAQGTALNARVVALREMRQARRLRRGWEHIARIADQYRRIIRVGEDNSVTSATDTGLMLALAYPERIAAASSEGVGRFVLASGATAFVDHSDEMSAHDWIAIGSMNARGGRVFLASPLHIADLTDASLIDSTDASIVAWRNHIAWDGKKGALIARREQRIGSLVVSAQPLDGVGKEQLTAVICDAATKHGASMFTLDDHVHNLQRRVAAVAAWHPELALPSLSTDDVMAHAAQWLPFWLEGAGGRLRTSAAELKKIDMCAALWSLLSWEQQQEVDRLAPTHIKVPTGSMIRVEYRQGAEQPIVRVRLQECFGLQATPRVDGGRQPVLMELLSPGFKPVQLTQDLHSFWQNTYFEVRKELKRRYPKHAWPDNPLEAEAVRGVRRKPQA